MQRYGKIAGYLENKKPHRRKKENEGNRLVMRNGWHPMAVSAEWLKSSFKRISEDNPFLSRYPFGTEKNEAIRCR
jgi:hypothetical protein